LAYSEVREDNRRAARPDFRELNINSPGLKTQDYHQS